MLSKCNQSVAANWLKRSVPIRVIVEELDCHPDDLHKVRVSGQAADCPTPREIAQRAAEVRQGWTASEHRRRRAYQAPDVMAPFIRIRDCRF